MNYFTYDYATILPYSTISSLLNNDNGMIQASPKWGKRGVGFVIPLAFLLFFYNAFLLMLFASFSILGASGLN